MSSMLVSRFAPARQLAQSAHRLSRCFATQPVSENTSQDHPSSQISNTDAQVLMDQLFQKNKPSWSLTHRNALPNVQQPKKFTSLDKKLLELESRPVDFHYYLRNLSDLKSANQLPYKFGTNQHVTNDPRLNHFLRQIVWEFDAPIRYAFGYGSKVFSQGKDVDVSRSQVDMVFAVSYPDHWHSLNLHQYPQHYSWLRLLGSEAIASIENLGAGVYFNPFVKMHFSRSKQLPGEGKDFEIKYGVTSVDNLIDDLTNWSSMYLSGRMQKPVAIVRDTPQISLLEQFNLVSALKLAILMIGKSSFDEVELYKTITSVSYMGDPRITLGGENPHKVDNIVSGQFKLFRELYVPLIRSYFGDNLQIEGADRYSFKVNMSPKARAAMVSELPRKFREKLLSKFVSKYQNEFSKDLVAQNVVGRLPSITRASLKPVKSHKDLSFMELQDLASDPATRLSEIPVGDWEYIPANSGFKTEDFVQKVSVDETLPAALRETVKQTVGRPAFVQMVKGILTAGIGRSCKYALEKKRKYLQGRREKRD